ncbi:SHOCT domain-containing protein [Streptomyces globosus]|uniref:SHOCT domain-containing protein n=1 Tax=Streptomyces globosus TaxID=68209 RepID=A0A344TWF4_9ACTN|nr:MULTISPECIES: SHOCT domain-containing protein [Streptomyces]AXE22975.1 SHOCT domain-containing protein [Streptomyces globosus]
MFIRPVGTVVHPARRPAGRPLLRGLLARGAYVWDAAQAPHRAPDHGPRPTPWQPGRPAPAEPDSAAPAPAPAPAPPPADSAPTPPGPGPAVPAGGSDLAASLAQLAALAREGLLTPEEFSAAKARLLST